MADLRSLPDFEWLDRELARHLLEIGHVVWRWNALHERLGVLFHELTEVENNHISFAVWQSYTSDRAQRSMLLDVIKARYAGTEDPEEQWIDQELRWALKEIESISDARNNAVHAPLAFFTEAGSTALRAADHLGNKRAGKLRNRELLVEFAWCAQRARQLEDNLAALAMYANWIRAGATQDVARISRPTRRELPSREAIARLLSTE